MTLESTNTDPVRLRHRNLEKIAMAALQVGRLLIESGAKASVIHKGTSMVVSGLGAQSIALRVGYASLSMTVAHGGNTITRMIHIGHHGVNLRINSETRALCVRISEGGMSPEDVEQAVNYLSTKVPRHTWPVVALTTGLACASFGQLLGTDALAFPAIFIAGVFGQSLRHFMIKNHLNLFAIVAIVAFASSLLGALGASLIGSSTPEMAMFASVLLLVPGVPAMNAQTDIMEGFPTLGSARAITVMMILTFLTVGVAISHGFVIGGNHVEVLLHHDIATKIVFGACAAAGFGILFNFGWGTVGWAALGGALALAVRTLGLDVGWSLAMASTIAAIVVTVGVRLLYLLPTQLSTGGSMLAVAGCIPMIPGSAAAHGILGLLASSGPATVDHVAFLGSSLAAILSAIFTIGGIGAGITITNALSKRSDFPKQ